MLNSPEKIEEILRRGVESVLPSRDFVRARLEQGSQLTVYLGIDPTGPTLHIGHAITLKKLAQFQALGHKIILLVGDFTARIGDPTDKLATRTTLTPEQVANNLSLYKDQASKLISFDGPNPAEFKFNSEWLEEMRFADVLELASKVTVQQMMERDMFRRRLEEGKPIFIHEFMYPLMQGYDSVAMMVDGEVGGNDQMFNMLMGRELLKEHGKEKFTISVKLLADARGVKMGKSEGNMVALSDSASDMFGKIMSWTDGMVIPGFELCTDISEDDILGIELGMQNGDNPIVHKKRLAREIVAIYHGADAAVDAQEAWEKTFSDGGIPDDMQKIVVTGTELLVDVLLPHGIIASKSDFRRLVEGGAITRLVPIEEKVTDAAALALPGTYKIGKMRFVELVQN